MPVSERAVGLTTIDGPTGSVAGPEADQEPATKKILLERKRRREQRTLLRRTPRGSHQNGGHAKHANAALETCVRTLCARLKEKDGRDLSSRDSSPMGRVEGGSFAPAPASAQWHERLHGFLSGGAPRAAPQLDA